MSVALFCRRLLSCLESETNHSRSSSQNVRHHTHWRYTFRYVSTLEGGGCTFGSHQHTILEIQPSVQMRRVSLAHARHIASFPGPAYSLLTVWNPCRGPGLVRHMMCAAAYITAISLRINDVIGWASAAFYVERGFQRSQWRFVRKLS